MTAPSTVYFYCSICDEVGTNHAGPCPFRPVKQLDTERDPEEIAAEAEHFGIDLVELEREKVAILDEQRALNARVLPNEGKEP